MTQIEENFRELRNRTKEKSEMYLQKKTASALKELENAKMEYYLYCEILLNAMFDADPDIFSEFFI